jgi:hypothetical protein
MENWGLSSLEYLKAITLLFGFTPNTSKPFDFK